MYIYVHTNYIYTPVPKQTKRASWPAELFEGFVNRRKQHQQVFESTDALYSVPGEAIQSERQREREMTHTHTHMEICWLTPFLCLHVCVFG
jgi:hypothetical protein